MIEDHAATRSELRQALAAYGARIELVAAFGDGESLLAWPGRDTVEVALVDLGLPGMSGSATIAALSASSPRVRALALTVFEDPRIFFEALRAGAFGYLLKDEPAERLVTAIEEAADGASPVSSRVAGLLIRQVLLGPPRAPLSDREEELARALAEGLSYAECAGRMGIALGTVQDYVKRIYRKLDVSSKKEVRLWMQRQGPWPA